MCPGVQKMRRHGGNVDVVCPNLALIRLLRLIVDKVDIICHMAMGWVSIRMRIRNKNQERATMEGLDFSAK